MAITALPPPGPLRARALLDAAAETDDVLGSLHLFARALDQPGLTPDLRAKIHVLRAQFESAGLGRIDDAIGSFDAAAASAPPSLYEVKLDKISDPETSSHGAARSR